MRRRRTIEQVRQYVNKVNGRLFSLGQRYKYYRVNSRNEYKALDIYVRCDECKANADRGIQSVCNKDIVYDTLGAYDNATLYEMMRTTFNTLSMM